jgi:hypothetical protein
LLLKPELHHWFVGAALVTIGYLVYQKFVAEPKQLKRRMKCLLHKKLSTSYNGVASDSLYKLSLNGSEGKFDLLKLRMSILVLMLET